MSHNAIEYFATLGRKEGELTCKTLLPIGADNDDQTQSVHPSDVWGDAITDIEIIYTDQGECVLDSSWELIDLTIDKSPADCLQGVPILGSVYIAIQRRKTSLRIDHICDIAVVYMGEDVPEGFQVINKSISGESYFENGSTISRSRLAIRRADSTQAMLIEGMPLIDDICVINRSLNEFEPDDYVIIDRSLQQPKNWSGENMIIAYHKREALGLCDLKYESATLDRFPKKDCNGLALPVDELPMFVFPHGLLLKHCKKQSFPLPDFYTFVFTDVHGRHLYTTCLRFYEVIPQDEVRKFSKLMYGDDESHYACNEVMDIFSPKVICVVSQYPFYRAMGRFLKQLYSLSLSPSFSPIEHFVASVVSQIPVPVAGGRPFYVVLDAALISNSSRSMQPIKFELPSKSFFPPMDLDFSGPMRCLSLDHLLAIFCLLLQESKVIFICESNALLTDVMETFRALLFPLTWSSCFVTRLPDLLSGLLQAPGGFMIGLHTLLSSDSNSADIYSKCGADQPWISCLQSGTYIVDLSGDNISYFNGHETMLLSPGKVSSILRLAPSGPLNKLQASMSKIAKRFKLCPQNVGKAQFDSVFEFQSFDADSLPPGVLWSDFPTMGVRDAFLRFMADMLGDYSRYMISSSLFSSSNFKTFQELFSVEEYQRDADKSARGLLDSLIETQMFVNLIQERLEVPSHHLLFFDKAVRRLKDLNMSTMASDNRHNPKYRQQGYAIAGYKVDASMHLYEHVVVLDFRDASFRVPSETNGTSSLSCCKFYLGNLSNVEHDLSRDSLDLTAGKGMDRRELVNQSDLNLEDFMQGPLIIPGPLLKERNIDRDGDAPTDREYIYDTCWPSFNHSITGEVTTDAVRRELRSIRDKRRNANLRSNISCQLFIREVCERNCFKFNHRLLNSMRLPTHYDAKDAALLTVFPEECKAAISLTAGIFNVSLVMLSARSLRMMSSSRDIIQALGILAHLDSMSLLYQVDESAWRSLIMASNDIEEGYFKENLIRLLMASLHSSGVVPNILTSTQHTANSSNPRATRTSDSKDFSATPNVVSGDREEHIVMDTFFHLEELGLAWFAQKIMPFEAISPPPPGSSASANEHFSFYDGGPKAFHTPPPTGGPSSLSPPSTMRRFSNIFKKNSAEQNIVRKVRRKSVKALVASVECASFMHLVKKDSYFSMQRPRGVVMLFSVPQVFPKEIIAESIGNRLHALSCVPSEDIKKKVGEVRELFNKIQKLKLGDEPSGAPTKIPLPANGSRILSGVVTVELHQACCLYNCNTEGTHVCLTTIYARVWTPSCQQSPIKTAPGLPSCNASFPDTTDDDSDEQKSTEDTTIVNLNIRNIDVDHVFVELYGDFKDDTAKSCSLFDQSLGVGNFTVGAIVDNETSSLDLQLLSSAGKVTAGVRLSVSFSPEESSASPDKISSQTSVESFFENKGGSMEDSGAKHVSLRSSSLDGEAGSASVSAPQVVKKSWRERLSFGLYKEDKCDKGEESITTEPLSDPPLKRIEETANANKQTCQLPEVLTLNLTDTADSTPVQDVSGLSMGDVGRDSSSEDITGKSAVCAKKLGEKDEAGVDPSAGNTTVNAEPDVNMCSEVKSAQEQFTRKMADIESISNSVSLKQKGVTGIYSCSPCLQCGYCMLDDEVMACWAGFPSLFSGDSVKLPQEQDILKSHAVVCAKCQSDIVPLLHVQQFGAGGGDGFSMHLLCETTTPYLSPFGVRFCMESVLSESGTDMLCPVWLLKNCPHLYWNLVWYSTRLDLPSGLLPRSWFQFADTLPLPPSFASEGEGLSFFGPIAVGWRKCTVYAKVKRIMCGESSELSIEDIFPGAIGSELDAAARIMSSVDSSLSGISTAFIQCSQLKSLQCCFGDSIARGMYLTFLMLSHFYKPPFLVEFQTNNLYLDLSKGTLFDRRYREVITAALTPEDFAKIAIDREELLSVTSSVCALSIRILFGLML